MSIEAPYKRTHVDEARVYTPNDEGVLIGYAYTPEKTSGSLKDIEWVELENDPKLPPGLILTYYQTQLAVISGLTLSLTLETRTPAPRSFLRTSSGRDATLHFDAVDHIHDASQIHDSSRYELGNCRMGTLEMLGIGSLRKYALRF